MKETNDTIRQLLDMKPNAYTRFSLTIFALALNILTLFISWNLYVSFSTSVNIQYVSFLYFYLFFLVLASVRLYLTTATNVLKNHQVELPQPSAPFTAAVSAVKVLVALFIYGIYHVVLYVFK